METNFWQPNIAASWWRTVAGGPWNGGPSSSRQWGSSTQCPRRTPWHVMASAPSIAWMELCHQQHPQLPRQHNHLIMWPATCMHTFLLLALHQNYLAGRGEGDSWQFGCCYSGWLRGLEPGSLELGPHNARLYGQRHSTQGHGSEMGHWHGSLTPAHTGTQTPPQTSTRILPLQPGPATRVGDRHGSSGHPCSMPHLHHPPTHWPWMYHTLDGCCLGIHPAQDSLGHSGINWDMFQCKDCLFRHRISNIKIRPSYECLILTMGIPILVRRHLYVEMAPNFIISLYPHVTVPSKTCAAPHNIHPQFLHNA